MTAPKPRWLNRLISKWTAPSAWNAALTQYLLSNHHTDADQAIRNFGQLRLLPGFTHHSDTILPVILMSGDIVQASQFLNDFALAFEQTTHTQFDFNHPNVTALLYLFGRSTFLTRHLLKYPELGIATLDSPFLVQHKPLDTMIEELAIILDNAGELDLLALKNILRVYKYGEYLRITIRELAELAPPTAILEELSSVAICCLRLALAGADILAFAPTVTIAQDAIDQLCSTASLAILGMGKLGGNELNYSSDIDLIFLYDESPDENNPRTPQQRQKVAQIVIHLISDRTGEGMINRVDMRLRPGGATAPLAQSIDATEWYYETHSDPWERQALIKATTIAGNLTWGNNLLKRLKSFIYSRTIDENTLTEIKAIKQRIEKEHLKEHHLNIKLGVGGIREIEFFVQTFQLLYGGANPVLRTPSTLDALAQLRQLGLVDAHDAQTLHDAYLFLRKLEHRLQMVDEQQLHILPTDDKQQRALARCLGYADEEMETARLQMLRDLKDVMIRVRAIFGGLFSQRHLEIQAAIRNSTNITRFEPHEEALINTISHQLTVTIRQSQRNLLATRYQRLFEKIGARLHHYEHLINHPSSLERLDLIADTSEFLWNYLLNHLGLLEQLEVSKFLYSRNQWETELSTLINDAEDEEVRINRLREFKHSITFLLGSAELNGLISYAQARSGLTMLAEVILQEAYVMAQKYVLARFGRPYTNSGTASLAILGMGKLGGEELTYLSDLDLIFIYSGEGETLGKRTISNQNYFVKLIQRLISILSTLTSAGYAYELDTRLRPSGNAGILVTPIDAYLKHHETSEPWEHQALIKARLVAGDLNADWITVLNQGLEQAAYHWQPPDDLDKRIARLRYRKEKELSKETTRRCNFKQGHGGLLDIEYLTQYLQLRHGHNIPEIRTQQTLKALEHLREHNILDADTVSELNTAYIFLRQLESYLRLLFDESTNLIDFDQVDTMMLLTLLQRHGFPIEDLFTHYQQTTANVRKIYLRWMPHGAD